MEFVCLNPSPIRVVLRNDPMIRLDFSFHCAADQFIMILQYNFTSIVMVSRYSN